MMQTDINCDMGEGIGNEEALMPFISSANIACGYHAGNEAEMKRMVDLCLKYNVAIGAHPSFPDKKNFGRTAMHLPAADICEMVKDQLALLNKIAVAAGAALHHVKPHGALYNMAAGDPLLANALAATVKDFDNTLICYGLSGSVMIDEAVKMGLRVAREVFADRSYQPDGSLTARQLTGSLLTDAGMVARQVLQMLNERKVMAVNGETVPIEADTVCIHGDGENAVELAAAIHRSLYDAGMQIKRFG